MIRIAALVLSLCAASGCAGHALAKDLPVDDHSAGHKVYVTKCAKCHRFYDPAKYSEADWEMWMAKMSKKAIILEAVLNLFPSAVSSCT